MEEIQEKKSKRKRGFLRGKGFFPLSLWCFLHRKGETALAQCGGNRGFPPLTILGVILILGSIAYGWIGLIGCNAMAIRYGRFWFILGWVIYAISWVTYGLGFLLAGAGGIAYAKKIFKRLFLQKGKEREISS